MDTEWDHLKVVLAVNRGGTLTAAALLLGVDQTTAGRRLSALEDQLGTQLFIRSKGGFQATEAGQIVIANAHRIEARLARMGEILDDTHHEAVGVLRLMGNTWMLQRLVAQALPSLLQEHPKLEMRLSGRLPPNIAFGEPTVSLWFDAPPHASDRATPLCSLAYAAYQSKTDRPKGTEWVQFQDDIVQGPSFSRQLKNRMNPATNMRLTATDAQILQGAIRAGLALGYLPICLGDEDPTLERVPDTEVIRRILHFHASNDARRLKRVQILHDMLVENIESVFAGEYIAPKKKVRRPGHLG